MTDKDFFIKMFEFLTDENMKDCKGNFKTVHDLFENGEHIVHSEKEYKDGKCVKDEGFDERKQVEDNNDSCKKVKICDIDKTLLENTNKELLLKVERLSKENAELKTKNEYLEKKLHKINTILGTN